MWIKKSLLILIPLCSLSWACDKAGDGQLPVAKGYEYPGISTLNLNDDGTNVLLWPSAPLPNVTYKIFMRQGTDPYSWEKPYKTLSQNTFQTDDLRFETKTCFAVRAFSENYKTDANTKELCTSGTEIAFKGAESLDRADSGRWLLKWSKVPFNGVKYQIFEADAAGSLSEKPLREVTETEAQVGPFPIGEVKCFAVRFVVASKPGKDANTALKCADANKILGFSGLEKVESRATGKVILSWTAADHPDVMGYVVYKGTDFKETVTTVSLRQTTNTTLSDLTPGEKVTFGIRAYSKDGSEDKNTRTVTGEVIDLRPLPFPGVKAAVISGKNEAQVSWTPVDGAKEYRIYVASGDANNSPTLDWSKPAQVIPASQGPVARVKALGDEMRHVFGVRSVSRFDVEDQNTATFQIDFPDQGAPGFSGVKSAKIVNGKVELNWDKAVGQVTRYRIYRAKGSASALDFSSTALPYEPGSSTSTQVSGFQANQSYSFAVRAEDKNGQIDTNNSVLTITVGTQSLPDFLGYISGQGLDEHSLKISFLVTRDGNVSSYKARLRKRGQTAWLQTNTIPQDITKTSLESVFTLLTDKTEYEILVTALDLWGNESGNDAVYRVSTLDLTPPTFDGVMTATQAAGSPVLTIAWNARPSFDIVGYRVYKSKTSMAGMTLKASAALPIGVDVSNSIDGAATQYPLSGLIKGQTYYFVAHALDSAGNEDSNSAQVTSVVLNSFPALSADVNFVRTPEMVAARQINLRAQDVDSGDTLTITRLSTTCSALFAKPALVQTDQNGKVRDASVNWIPDPGYINSNVEERNCAEIYQASDGESTSPPITITFTAYNRDPRNVVATVAAPVGGFKRNRNLDCAATGDDDDGNTLTWSYQWLKNNNPISGATSTTLTPVAGAFLPGDSLVCRASAFDDHATISASSIPVVFGNDPPRINSVSVSKDGGSLPLLVTDKVACVWSGSDPDGDPLTYGAVVVESSANGTDNWTEQSLDSATCSLIQSTRRCFTVSTAVRRQYLRCKVSGVSDGFANVTAAATSASSLFVTNSSPRINSVTTTPVGAVEVGTSLGCVADISDLDGDSLSAASIQWTRDNVSISGATNNAYILQAADRNKSIRCEVSVAANSDGAGGAAQGPIKSAARSYSNSNPRIAGVTISPTVGIVSGTTLTCNPNVVDPDGDAVNLLSPFGIYSWTSNDGSGDQILVGNSGATFVVTPDLRGRILKCRFGLAANADGQGSAALADVGSSNSVAPVNSAPVISNVSITASAAPAVTATILTCNRTISDPDGDNILELPRYLWKANGISISGQTNQTFSLRKTDRGKNVTCSVNLPSNSDGKITPPVAEVASSNVIVSQNSQPSIADVLVVSDTPSPFYPSSIFNCQIGSVSDADGDTPTPQFAWYAGGAEILGQSNQTYTATADDRTLNISCHAKLAANADGFGSAAVDVASGNQLPVSNRAPEGNYRPIAEKVGGGTIYKDAQLNCRLPVLSTPDLDGDITTAKYIWRRNGSLYPGQSLQGTTNPVIDLTSEANTVPGDTFTCQILLSDGILSTASLQSTSLSISNHPPTIVGGSTISISPLTVYNSSVTTSLSCNGTTFSDADGDSLTVTSNWYIRDTGSSNGWSGLRTGLAGSTLTASVVSNINWPKNKDIFCSMTATDTTGQSVTTPAPGGGGMSVATATVLNSKPVGTLACNGGSYTVTGFSGAAFTPTTSCLSSGTTFVDNDAENPNFVIDYDPLLTTCTGIGTKILFDNTTGALSGVMPTSACKITLKAQDGDGEVLRNGGGTIQMKTFNFVLPFATSIGIASLDDTCKLTVPTSFEALSVAFGSSTYSVTGVASNPKSHTNPGTTTGVVSANIDPNGGGGPVLVTWNITGNPSATTQTLSKSLLVVDSPATGSVPVTPVLQPGLQPTPAPDAGGTRAAGCSLATCTGTRGSISAGMFHSCAVSSSKDLYCWGDNLSGEIGNGVATTPSSPEPQKVDLGTAKVSAVSGGGMLAFGVSHTCAIVQNAAGTSNLGVRCWGDNSYGQLGRGYTTVTPSVDTSTPAQVSGLNGGTGSDEIVSVSSGGAHTCILRKESGQVNGSGVWCWGANDQGQLGSGTQQLETTPIAVVGYGTAGAKAIALGGKHTCIVTSVGTVACWGQNKDLQLGVDNVAGGDKFRTTPVTVPNLNNVVGIAAGDAHTCALLSNGDVKCWGSAQSGQLGDSTLGGTTSSPRPFFGSVVDGQPAIAVAAGGSHSCALLKDGSVRCWGLNSSGQLGDNSTALSAVPVVVQNVSNAALSLELGANHTCILKNTGGVSCFGYYGGLGLAVPQKRPINNAMPQSGVTPAVPAAQFMNCRVLRAVEN